MADLTAAIHESSQIFVLDDNPANLLFVRRLLEKAGYSNVHCSSEPGEALQLCRFLKPDLVILDLHMPGVSGYEVLEAIRSCHDLPGYLPILVFTADATGEARRKALGLGASDFLTKPGDMSEITLRVRNFLEMRHLYRKLEDQNAELEEKVYERTRSLVDAQMELVERLALASDYRDDDTGEHCRRVGDLSFEIAIEFGLMDHEAELIRLAAPLHDIGKLGISDAVLRKPGKLTDLEFEEIQKHTLVGARILADSRSEILQMAHEIALSHHERWDGQGYPNGIRGDMIPVSGRIVAVADVFDALTNRRPYKEPWSVEQAVTVIQSNAGSQFDPAIVEAFLAVMDSRKVRQVA
ncbi:MAG TPA: HD domain-containing phosphohydrolase [Fimbriimonadaceae bacterium]|nr:HD domain-containing phosphohydrolase [Fimbriimonadaceae bacterium]